MMCCLDSYVLVVGGISVGRAGAFPARASETQRGTAVLVPPSNITIPGLLDKGLFFVVLEYNYMYIYSCIFFGLSAGLAGRASVSPLIRVSLSRFPMHTLFTSSS